MTRAAAIILLLLFFQACADRGPRQVTVIGTDYAFDAPATLAPGPTAFVFENRGQVDHEVVFALLREGFDMNDVQKAIQEGLDPEEMVEGGASILIARPGETSAGRVLLDLLPGRTYALVCTFTDDEGAPPHIALGMVGSFEVE